MRHQPVSPSPALIRYMDRISQTPELTQNEFAKLMAVMRKHWIPLKDVKNPTDEQIKQREIGLRARNKIVLANVRLACKFVHKYRRAAPLEDLLSAAIAGLIHAIEIHDEKRGKLSTAAFQWMRAEVNKEIRGLYVVKIPQHCFEKNQAIKKAVEELKAAKQTPTAETIAAHMGESAEFVQKYIQLPHENSLEVLGRSSSDDEPQRHWSELLPDSKTPSVLDQVASQEEEERLSAWLRLLSDEHQELIELKYGLNGKPALKVADIAKLRKLSDGRVRARTISAMRELRKMAREAA